MQEKSTKEKTLRNGVDVLALKETINAIKGRPALAAFKFRSTNTWINCGHNRSRIRGFYGALEENKHKTTFVYDADEPAALLGDDNGANPVEFVLVALAGCLTTGLVYHAAARGIIIESVQSTLEGDIDLRGFLGLSDDVHKGYNNISVTMKIKSDAPAEKLKELTEFSPVLDTLTRAVPVKINVETV
jgi:uncharacterized OsmC-like protein